MIEEDGEEESEDEAVPVVGWLDLWLWVWSWWSQSEVEVEEDEEEDEDCWSTKSGVDLEKLKEDRWLVPAAPFDDDAWSVEVGAITWIFLGEFTALKVEWVWFEVVVLVEWCDAMPWVSSFNSRWFEAALIGHHSAL